MKLSFAPLEGSGLEAALTLMNAFCDETGLAFEPFERRRAINELIANPDLGNLWLIVGDQEAVGYMLLSFGFSMETGGRDGMVDELYIKPGCRGRGIATRAMRYLDARAHALGLRALYLEVRSDDRKAQRFYRKLGFEVRSKYCLARLDVKS